MLTRQTPCRYCCDRAVGCHGVCKDYIEWSNQQAKLRESIYEQKRIASDIEYQNGQTANRRRSKNTPFNCHKK